jgi:hypothetical protein
MYHSAKISFSRKAETAAPEKFWRPSDEGGSYPKGGVKSLKIRGGDGCLDKEENGMLKLS